MVLPSILMAKPFNTSDFVEKCKNEPGFKQIAPNKFVIPQSCLEKERVINHKIIPLSDFVPTEKELKECNNNIKNYKYNSKIFDKSFVLKMCIIEKRKNKNDMFHIKKQETFILNNYCKNTHYLKYNEYKKCTIDNIITKEKKLQKK